MRRFRASLVFALVGMIFWMVGSLFKILHWGFGVLSPPTLLLFGTVLVVIACIIAIITVLRTKTE
jgi:hypothetical protein